MTAILKQLADLWRKLSATQRVLVCALLSLAVIGSLLASFVGASPSYVLLKDGLDPAALSDALAALDGAGVRRKVGSNRDEILVDERDFERAREVAAREKIFATSASDPEWEAAGSTSLGLTEEQRRRRDLLAKQKTLAKTLETYVGIERATVTLTPGSRGFSKREISPAKAAVVLKLKDGFLPDALQTEAIQRVVAAALPDLVADNVAISDTRGVLLSRGAGIAASGTPAFERKRYVERHLADKAQSALDLAFGAGRAQVRVDARLEMESLEESVRTLDPETQVKLQEKTTSSTGASRGAGGVVGADSQAKGASRDSGAGSSSEETSTTYEYARTETIKRREAGKVERLTVAVALDAALSSEETKVRDLVKNAVGFDATRNDEISVSVLAFAPAPPPEVVPAEGFDPSAWLPIARWIGSAAVALGLAWWAMRAVKSAKAAMAAAVRDVEHPPEKEAALKRPTDPTQRVADEIERDPQSIGTMLRGWLYEGAPAR